jgi:hypothetical protein
MKKHRTAIGVGLFVGAIFMLIQWTLCTLVLLGGQISKKSLMAAQCQKEGLSGTSDTLALLVGLALLLEYIVFEALLVKAKDALLSDAPLGTASYPANAFTSIDAQHDEALTAV